jgi:hypothetical protein
MVTVTAAVAAAGVHDGSAFFHHATAVAAAACASAAVAAAAARVVILVHPFAVQGRDQIARQQCAGCPARSTTDRCSAISRTAVGTAFTWLSAGGRITSPFAVVDFATATTAADKISFCLPQGLNRTKGNHVTTDVTAIAVAASVAGQSATTGTTAHRYRAANGRQTNAHSKKQKNSADHSQAPNIRHLASCKVEAASLAHNKVTK